MTIGHENQIFLPASHIRKKSLLIIILKGKEVGNCRNLGAVSKNNIIYSWAPKLLLQTKTYYYD